MNLLGWDGQTPLHLAACSSTINEEMERNINANDESILITLLRHNKIRINIQDDKGRTPLHHAIMRNHIAITEILFYYNANPEVNLFSLFSNSII